MALKQKDGEILTIDATAGGVGITASKLNGKDILAAEFHHDAGGKILFTTDTDVTITQSDVAGGIPQQLGDQWRITGRESIVNFKGIRRTGEASATVFVTLWGHD